MWAGSVSMSRLSISSRVVVWFLVVKKYDGRVKRRWIGFWCFKSRMVESSAAGLRLVEKDLEIAYDQVGSGGLQSIRVAMPRKADDTAKAPRPPGLDTGDRILDDDSPSRLDAEFARGFEKHVGSGFPRQAQFPSGSALHPPTKKILLPATTRHGLAIIAG